MILGVSGATVINSNKRASFAPFLKADKSIRKVRRYSKTIWCGVRTVLTGNVDATQVVRHRSIQVVDDRGFSHRLSIVMDNVMDSPLPTRSRPCGRSGGARGSGHDTPLGIAKHRAKAELMAVLTEFGATS